MWISKRVQFGTTLDYDFDKLDKNRRLHASISSKQHIQSRRRILHVNTYEILAGNRLKIKHNTIQYGLLLFAIVNSFAPQGAVKLHLVLMGISLIYIAMLVRYRVSSIYTILLVYVCFLGMLMIINNGIIQENIVHMLIWMHPYVGMKLQVVNKKMYGTTGNCSRMHRYFLAAMYIIYFIRILFVGHDMEISGNVFRSSSLALLGTLIALEIFREKKKTVFRVIAILLLILPVIGALRQYVYVLFPIIAYLLISKKEQKLLIMPVLFVSIALTYTPARSIVSSMQKDTEYKASNFEAYLLSAVNPDREDTFTGRQQWWIDAITRTVRKNSLFGHSLTYRFVPYSWSITYSSSSRLHNYYVSAFADGGILLISIIIAIFIKSIKRSIAQRDHLTTLAIYTFIITFGMNTTALTTYNSYIMFYIYGYYDLQTYNKRQMS